MNAEDKATLWALYVPLIGQLHTDHRNNCIKAMQKQYKAGVKNNNNEDFLRLEQENHEDAIPYNTGEARPMKREYELMRQNPIANARFVNQFASSVIGAKNWGYEGKNPMHEVVGGTTQFNQVITASDEAFMLVCMESYREWWLAEAKKKHALKHNESSVACMVIPDPNYTRTKKETYRSAGAENGLETNPAQEKEKRGSGWSIEGINRFNKLHGEVLEDRSKASHNTTAFHRQLEIDLSQRIEHGKTKKTSKKRPRSEVPRAVNDF